MFQAGNHLQGKQIDRYELGSIVSPAIRSIAARKPQEACCPPSLDLFNPARAARFVRAGTIAVEPAVPNRLCLDIEILSGPARQKMHAPRLRPVYSDMRFSAICFSEV